MERPVIKVLIVDDEPLARKYIRGMLAGESDIDSIAEAGSGRTALRAIARSKPDLVFLDIQMPAMDGFAMLEKLDCKDLPVIVFTTAYEEFAIRAFEVHAIDYLLKPFDKDRFARSLEYARNVLAETPVRQRDTEQLAELVKTIREKPQFLQRLLVKRNGRIFFVKMDDIDWVKADDKYIHLHGDKNRHMIRQTLASFKTQLDPARFIQINRSVIVNLDSIKELHAMFNGDYDVELRDGSTFILSRSHRKGLFDLLGKPLS